MKTWLFEHTSHTAHTKTSTGPSGWGTCHQLVLWEHTLGTVGAQSRDNSKLTQGYTTSLMQAAHARRKHEFRASRRAFGRSEVADDGGRIALVLALFKTFNESKGPFDVRLHESVC